jgi:molecular chaperone DnaK
MELDSLLFLLVAVAGCAEAPSQSAKLSRSVGIETLGGNFTPLLEKGIDLPASRSQTFSTAEDNQDQITVHVLRGDTAKHESLGQWQVSGIRPTPRGTPSIAITFSVDTGEHVSLTARDNDTGAELKVSRLNDADGDQ